MIKYINVLTYNYSKYCGSCREIKEKKYRHNRWQYINLYSIWGSQSCEYEKFSILSDLTPCSLLKANRRFGKTYRFHLQSRRKGHSRNQHLTGGKRSVSSRFMSHGGFFLFLVYSFTLKMEAVCTTNMSSDYKAYIPETTNLRFNSYFQNFTLLPIITK
jgi:hypothetical protein